MRIASLVALCWAVYGQTLGFGYVPFDDHEIYDNPLLTSGLSLEHVRYFFSHYAGPNWFPLNWLSHMAVIELFGPKPWGEHLANVLLHTGSTLLLYLFLRRATGSAWRSWLVAGLFAAHPLHAESVAWISERKDVLSGFFFMLVLLAYERYVRRRGLLRYLSVFALLLLGLMAKSMLVTLPCVLLLADFWPFARLRRPGDFPRLLVEKLPFFALSLFFSLIAYYGAAQSGTIGQGTDTQTLHNAANAFTSYVVYLKRLFLPIDLAFFYPHPGTAFPLWKGGLALAGIAALTLLLWRQRRKRPYALMGWCWFLGMLVPVIGIVQPGLQGMADRYAYLPFIGLYIALVWLVADLDKIRHASALWKIGAACALLVLLSARAWDQARTWRSAEALAVSALANTRGNYVAHMLLMGVRGKQGLTEAAKKQYELASAINPYYVSLYHNRHALQCLTRGEYGKALEHYQRAHAIQPTAISAYNLGTILERLGRREEAREMLRNALERDPGLQPARKALERFSQPQPGQQGNLFQYPVRFPQAVKDKATAVLDANNHPAAARAVDDDISLKALLRIFETRSIPSRLAQKKNAFILEFAGPRGESLVWTFRLKQNALQYQCGTKDKMPLTEAETGTLYGMLLLSGAPGETREGTAQRQASPQ